MSTISKTSEPAAAESTAPVPPGVRQGTPPGPKRSSLIQSATFMSKRHQRWLRRERERFGNVFTIDMLGFGKIVMVADPSLAKQVFTADPTVLHAGTGSPLGAVLGANSLLAIDEDFHLRQRRLLLPPFHGDRMQAFDPVIEEITAEEIAGWPEDREFAVLGSMQQITLRAILRTIFGAKGAELQALEQLIPRTVDWGARLVQLRFLHHDLGKYSPWGRFLWLRGECERHMDILMDEARNDPDLAERTDILAALVQATHEDGSPMTDQEIRDQLLTLMIAGHETTATTLAWAVERLTRNPDALAKLTAEAREGDDNAYREAVFRETLRARPTVTMSVRFVKKPYVLDGWELPYSTRIALHPGLTHYDPALFPQPFEFRPERFLDVKPGTYEWIPFGGGVRRCIGASFAQMEVDVVLRTVLRRFDLLPTDAPDEKWKFRGVTFVPHRGGRVRVRRAKAQ